GQRLGAVPQFQQGELVRVLDALEELEFLAPPIGSGQFAAGLEGFSEFGALARGGGDRDDEADGHVFLPDAAICLTACYVNREKTSTAAAHRDNNAGPQH